MIRSLLRAPQDKLQQLDCLQLPKYEYNILEELVDIMTPFENATLLLLRDKVVTSSLVPCVRGLTAQLNQLSSKYNCKLVGALKSSFTKHMAEFAQKDTYILATSLDSRFKLKWTHGDELEKYTADLVTKACQTSTAATSACTAAEADDTTALPPKKTKMKTDFLNMFMAPQPTASQPVAPSSVQLKVQDYLQQPVLDRQKDPLIFWASQDTE